jgi:two-component system chemotaxis response regulator CheY
MTKIAAYIVLSSAGTVPIKFEGAMTVAVQILIVDDDQEIREMVEYALAEEGYAVITAQHGAAALEVLEQHCPSLILLDMRMPVMDGWTFARTYRQRPEPHVPIVVMTAAIDAAQWSREVSAAAVIPKPFELNRLFDTVKRHARPLH